MSSISDLKKVKIKLILIIVSITLLATLIVYLLVRSLSNEGSLHKSEMEIMNKKFKDLNQSLGALQGKYNLLDKDRDSLKTHVDYFWPLRSLVYNAKLRDQVGGALELSPGDVAMLKTDSSRVIVLDIKVGGNDLSYYINYSVKTKKGEIIEVSPYEITKFSLLK
jgi:hypothetical protein